MHTRIIRVGNSQGIVLPKKLLQQYHLSGEVELRPTPEGLLIAPVARPARQGWAAQMQAALADGQEPEGELLEGFSDTEFEDSEWQW
ncbi:MAG: AbrB/MazE/SpoVT family DNA-binding domain-containing protein [Hymenobacter sp.]|nr:MAG: AbrB/MazE/SpoVT family DNA-binding domain-containing protein [Hymenobacter sp.]